MTGEVVCRTLASGRKLDVLSGAKLLASSEGLGWKGVQVHVGMLNRGWAVDELVVDGHWLTINLGNSPVSFEAQCGAELWNAREQAPWSFCINPRDRPFSVRHSASVCFASCMIDDLTMNNICGGDYELPANFDLSDDVLAGIMRAIAACLFDKRNSNTKPFLDDLLRKFLEGLSTRHGVPVTPSRRGAITRAELDMLVDWLKVNLSKHITVDDLASLLGQSNSHFSREFKREVGVAPWTFVTKLRLDAALDHMSDGCPIAEAAIRSGFSDVAHLRRTHERHFGIPLSLRH
ncbi:MAG: AraC family transcriptional regulator [Novosphingobium sp.]